MSIKCVYLIRIKQTSLVLLESRVSLKQEPEEQRMFKKSFVVRPKDLRAAAGTFSHQRRKSRHIESSLHIRLSAVTIEYRRNEVVP